MKNLGVYLALTGATSGGLVPGLGEITAVNAAQNFAASLAQDVSGYLAGLPAPDEEESLNTLVPLVETGDFFQFAKADDEAFLTEADDSDVRGIGASFKRIEHRGSVATDATVQKGLTQRVDHRTLPRVNGTIQPGWENRAAAGLRMRLIRADKARGLALLEGAAANTNKTWNAASNPDGDIRAMVQRTRTKTGMLPTHLVLGSSAQQLRQDAFEAPTRANHVMANHAGYTLEQLAGYAGAGQAIIEEGIKMVKEGASKTNQLALAVYSYSAEQSPMIDDRSNIKRAWSPTLGGGMWAVFIQEGAAWTDITVFHQSKIFVPIATGIEKLTVSA